MSAPTPEARLILSGCSYVSREKMEQMLRDFLEEETPTNRQMLISEAIGKLSAIQERTEALMDLLRAQGLNDPLAKAEAIRALMRIRDLVDALENIFGLPRRTFRSED